MALLSLSSHTCTPALLILTPPFSSSLTRPTISPPPLPPPSSMSVVGDTADDVVSVTVVVCVCVSAVGWQRNNNNAACPTSFIRLHKLIRPRRSHHLLYWEWRQNTGTKCGTWVAECVPILVCLHVLEGVCNEISVQCAFKMGNWKCVSLFYSRGGTLCGSYKFAK